MLIQSIQIVIDFSEGIPNATEVQNATLQVRSIYGEVQANLVKAGSSLKDAAQKGAKLVVVPEYMQNRSQMNAA